MKHYAKKLITLMIAMMLAFTMVTPATAQAATQKYTISVKKKTVKKKKTIKVGTKMKLTVKNGKKKLNPKKVKFKSSNKKVATVSKKGVIAAKKAGKTTITIKYKKKSAKITLTIKKTTKKAKKTINLNDISKNNNEHNQTEANKDSVIIDGITFNIQTENLTNIGGIDELLGTQLNGVVTISTDKNINTNEIKTVINNDNNQFLGDNTKFNQQAYNDTTVRKSHTYVTPSWSNRNAVVSYNYYDKKIEILAVPGIKTGNFPVAIYYNNKLIRSFNFYVVSAHKEEVALANRIKQIQNNAWENTPGLSVPEKMQAVDDYCYGHFTYEAPDWFDCKDGAEVLRYTALDLNLESWYTFTYFVTDMGVPGTLEDGSYGIDLYRQYDLNCAVPNGHTAIAYIYDGNIYHIGTEGHD